MNDNFVLGIDEAGRGPALGPMVLAAVVLDEEAARLLAAQGVRDSKAFGSSVSARRTRAILKKKGGFESLYVLPLLVKDEVVGTFTVAAQRAGAFPADRREMLGVIANQVAISMQNGRMVQAACLAASGDISESRGSPWRDRRPRHIEGARGACEFDFAASARKIDIVARYGGEEFALVLEGTDRTGARRRE